MEKRYLAVFSRRHKISTYTPTHDSWMDCGSNSDVKEILSIEKFLFGVITRKKSLLLRL